ncbi:hypothetical protein BGW36DRAFT_35059 [Talaromyces proteolyticus]|uniref:YCII-related domain-containing protein n=1 Tax=Talaromyces proteolyticus TaxID=1131652 RepID=A0AAD4PXU5_9EURO|nr:uncharacterized protein BGW36DRAFT_35059 [Talaromyces proteolyticus]KAH8693138.1 hypothetical protein BGW36DRAFT_35059 [Talaromyces proteolyticus]
MSAKLEWLCIVPDKPGMNAKRIEVRPTHLANLGPLLESKTIVAGAMFTEAHPTEGSTPQFKGSMVIIQAGSLEEVRGILSKDVYTQSGVWDLENTQIIPYKSAVRLPM